MIDAAEVATRARKLDLDPARIEADHIMNCVLAAIADATPKLTFRGGTALARAYWPDFSTLRGPRFPQRLADSRHRRRA